VTGVTLVIPGRNCAATLDACLAAVTPRVADGQLAEIIFVDDASTDESAAIAAKHGVRILQGPGRGAGLARNIGWQAASTELIWFIDSDCVAQPDALEILVEHIAPDDVGAVGGSYGNMRPNSLLASLIHAEIVQRHQTMPLHVDFLATFNVLYKRAVLAEVGGFDVRFVKAQDAELAYRVRRAGYRLRFDARSQVGHFHLTDLRPYLRVQHQQGYYRAFLYAAHPERMSGDAYSGFSDHVQPPLALAMVALSPTLLLGPVALVEWALAGALLGAQLPMTWRILKAERDPRYAAFAPMSFMRAFSRGVGFARGVAAAAIQRAAQS